MLLRQRLSQLLTCIEDMSSDDEASEEVSRTLDEAFQLCGRYMPTDAFRLTACTLVPMHTQEDTDTNTHMQGVLQGKIKSYFTYLTFSTREKINHVVQAKLVKIKRRKYDSGC